MEAKQVNPFEATPETYASTGKKSIAASDVQIDFSEGSTRSSSDQSKTTTPVQQKSFFIKLLESIDLFGVDVQQQFYIYATEDKKPSKQIKITQILTLFTIVFLVILTGVKLLNIKIDISNNESALIQRIDLRGEKVQNRLLEARKLQLSGLKIDDVTPIVKDSSDAGSDDFIDEPPAVILPRNTTTNQTSDTPS